MILNRQTRIPVALAPLRKFLEQVERDLRLDGHSVSVCFVSDRAIALMNSRFRGKQGPTDVLSFPATEKSNRALKGFRLRRCGARARRSNGNARAGAQAEMALHLGDIAISPETARRNARRFGRSLPEELRVLILHGVLHLMGYDHETDSGEMDRIEANWRKRLKLS
jgi:probable rRNA maturation factor